MSYRKLLTIVIWVVIAIVIIALAISLYEAQCIDKAIHMNLWK